MKVKLKFGHHNGERFYNAGEIMECPENLGISLIRQGLAAPFIEKKEQEKIEAPKEAAQNDAPKAPEQDKTDGQNGQETQDPAPENPVSENPAPEETEQDEDENSPDSNV